VYYISKIKDHDGSRTNRQSYVDKDIEQELAINVDSDSVIDDFKNKVNSTM